MKKIFNYNVDIENAKELLDDIEFNEIMSEENTQVKAFLMLAKKMLVDYEEIKKKLKMSELTDLITDIITSDEFKGEIEKKNNNGNNGQESNNNGTQGEKTGI